MVFKRQQAFQNGAGYFFQSEVIPVWKTSWHGARGQWPRGYTTDFRAMPAASVKYFLRIYSSEGSMTQTIYASICGALIVVVGIVVRRAVIVLAVPSKMEGNHE